MGRRLCFEALAGIPEVRPGDALAPLIVAALAENDCELGSDSIVVVAQKIVSKAEGRFAWLDEVVPSDKAQELARITVKDARLVELTLSESTRVLRAVPGVLIVRHRLGYVMANAGIDLSNVPGEAGNERALLPQTMFDTVLSALSEAHEIDHIAVVSSEPERVPSGVLALPEPGQGLNPALSSAAEMLRDHGARSLLVIHADLLQAAEALTLAGHGSNVGYSRKVFIPLTRLCRNTCGYCTFATTPLGPEEPAPRAVEALQRP